MDWFGYLFLALMAPGSLFMGTLVLVIWLGRHLHRLPSARRPPWQYAVAHVLVGMGAGFLPGISLLAMGAVPTVLLVQLKQAGALAGSGGVPTGGAAPPLLVMRGPRRWGAAVFIVAAGTLLPWAVGLGVKLHLDAQGQPTYPVSSFLDPVVTPLLLVLTLASWAYPFLFLGSAAAVPWRVGFGDDPERATSMVPIWAAFVPAVAAGIPIYVSVFWEFDTLLLIIPIGGIFLAPMALGYLAGWWWVRRGPGRRRGLGRGQPATPTAPLPPAPDTAPPAPPGTPPPPPAP